jgi:aspartokinase/homoserine dehydrogenase 1
MAFVAASGQAPAPVQLAKPAQLLATQQAPTGRPAAASGGISSHGVMAAAAMVAAGASTKSRKSATGVRGRAAKVVVKGGGGASQSKADLSGAWSDFGSKAWEVHKFGGASLNDAQLYATCGDLLISEAGRNDGKRIPTAAIVSACGGMTDALVGVVNEGMHNEAKGAELMEAAIARQVGILMELCPGRPELTDPVIANLKDDKMRVMSMLTAITLMRGVPPQMLELIAGLGEVWSAQTLNAYMNFKGVESAWMDARDVLIVPDSSAGSLGEKGMAIDTIDPVWDTTAVNMRKWWKGTFGEEKKDKAPFMIITGFVCSTESGRPTTLKRSGSDYSATLFAKLLDSCSVTMWKNVNGVYTADPRMVPAAFPVANMTFDEAMELAYFGGQVLHPSAMVPCIEKRIPVLVRNVFNPSHPGTKVYGRGDEQFRWEDQAPDDVNPQMPVTAITSIEKVALVTLAGASFLGTPGVARRMMEALGNAGVNVILTSQGSSEHSITVAVDESQADKALAGVEQAFGVELNRDSEIRVTKRDKVSILAVIGEGMKKRGGVAGSFFNALGRAKVNVIAIAQGSSERNISAVVERDELGRALRAAHDGFTLSDTTIAVGIIGTGNVGSELMRQLAKFQGSRMDRNTALPAMADVKRLNIEVRAILDTNKMIMADHGLPLQAMIKDTQTFNEEKFMDLDSWEKNVGGNISDFLKKLGDEKDTFEVSAPNFDALEDFMDTKRIPYKVLIDCTASDEIAALYPKWLKRGIHVISPNKLAGAGPMARYEDCLKASLDNQVQWRYEATVGAQMPIISTVQDIIQTGDTVHSIEGIFSGTLSCIFGLLNDNPGMKFSEACKKVRGDFETRFIMEPDPRDDLSGRDTARKMVILARQLGIKVEVEDVNEESLMGSCDMSKACSWEELLEKINSAGIDEKVAAKMEEAQAKGERLSYVGQVDAKEGKIFVGLRSFPPNNALGRVLAGECVCSFITDRYLERNPLALHGPGAGAQVTASGVFADLLRLSKTLGS